MNDYCTRLLKILATRYPTELDASLSHTLKKLDESKSTGGGKAARQAGKRLFELLSKSFAGTRHQPLVYVQIEKLALVCTYGGGEGL